MPEPGTAYTCARCGGTFTTTVPDAEAVAEREVTFPGVKAEEFVLVCDDCWEVMGFRSGGR